MEISLTIIIGAIGSLIATIIWIWIASLYVIGGRKRIDLLVEYAITTNRLLDNSLEFKHYTIALSQAEVLFNLLFEINSNIGYFNYSPKKRKLIHTIIFDSIRTLSCFKHLTIGYDGYDELSARCEKIKSKYFCDIAVPDGKNLNRNLIELQLLQELNRSKRLCDFFDNGLPLFRATKNQRNELYLNLIDVNSFKTDSGINYYMSSKALSKSEFENIINKCYKKSNLNNTTNE